MLADYEQLVSDLVRDDAARLTPEERRRAIAAAVLRYSTDKPRTKVQDVTPETAQRLPLPAAWEEGFSSLLAIEHPLGQVPPRYLDAGVHQVYDDGAARKILLRQGVEVAANSTRLSFTIRHAVSAAEDSIPLQDREPVACYAAASCCDQLASFYSGGSDSTIQADSVDGRSKAQEYASRARALRKRYFDELGIEDKKNVAAGVVVDLDQHSTLGEPRLLRGRSA
jgi:hypothetical protein